MSRKFRELITNLENLGVDQVDIETPSLEDDYSSNVEMAELCAEQISDSVTLESMLSRMEMANEQLDLVQEMKANLQNADSVSDGELLAVKQQVATIEKLFPTRLVTKNEVVMESLKSQGASNKVVAMESLTLAFKILIPVLVLLFFILRIVNTRRNIKEFNSRIDALNKWSKAASHDYAAQFKNNLEKDSRRRADEMQRRFESLQKEQAQAMYDATQKQKATDAAVKRDNDRAQDLDVLDEEQINTRARAISNLTSSLYTPYDIKIEISDVASVSQIGRDLTVSLNKNTRHIDKILVDFEKCLDGLKNKSAIKDIVADIKEYSDSIYENMYNLSYNFTNGDASKFDIDKRLRDEAVRNPVIFNAGLHGYGVFMTTKDAVNGPIVTSLTRGREKGKITLNKDFFFKPAQACSIFHRVTEGAITVSKALEDMAKLCDRYEKSVMSSLNAVVTSMGEENSSVDGITVSALRSLMHRISATIKLNQDCGNVYLYKARIMDNLATGLYKDYVKANKTIAASLVIELKKEDKSE